MSLFVRNSIGALLLATIISCQPSLSLEQRQASVIKKLETDRMGPLFKAATKHDRALGEALTVVAEKHTELQSDYDGALEQAGLYDALDPEAIQKDRSLRKTRKAVAKSHRVIALYRRKYDSLNNSFIEIGQAAGLSGDVLLGFGLGAREGVKSQKPLMDEFWSLESKIVVQIGVVTEHLHRTRSRWIVEDGQFTFYEDSDLKQLRKMEAVLTKLVKRSEALEARMNK